MNTEPHLLLGNLGPHTIQPSWAWVCALTHPRLPLPLPCPWPLAQHGPGCRHMGRHWQEVGVREPDTRIFLLPSVFWGHCQHHMLPI